MTSREEFLKKIRATFKVEAAEGIANITSNLIELEKEPPEARQTQLIEAIYREAHSLKGAARAVNINEIEMVCQSLEGVFSALKNKTLKLVPGLFDIFHHTVNTLSDVLAVADKEISDTIKEQVAELSMNLLKVEAGELDAINTGQEKPGLSETPNPDPASRIADPASRIADPVSPIADPVSRIADPTAIKQDNTIRISIEKLDDLLFQAEEMLALKLTFDHFSEGLRSTAKKLSTWTQEGYEVSAHVGGVQQHLQERLSGEALTPFEVNVKNVAAFFDWSSSLIKTVESDLDKMRKFSVQEVYNSGTKIESLLDEVKKMISVPFSTILDVFPKAARDISKDNGKEVTVIISGAEMEIDRRILEEIRNPLMHLLRNAVDHGIEKPQIRKQNNKAEKGTIQLVIDRLENSKVEVTISDDGAGIDLEKLKRKYIKQEKIPAAEVDQISEQVLLGYIFRSGISTSEMITDLSGRGLGLAIVQEKIEQLGGTVSIKTVHGKGTEFKIQIPLTLVTFRGVRIRVGEREFIVPTSKIDRVLRLEKTAVKTVENKATIPYHGSVIPLVYLSDILEIPYKEVEDDHIMVLVFGSMEQQIGFVVDGILDEEVVLVKKFNNQLKRVRNVAGATVLGSGKVIPILNVSDMLISAIKHTTHQSREKVSEKAKEKNSILVVEDSITSRILLKNILETAGYKVSTAIDGVEGYTKLKEEPFDLVVSDVDMPRMSGFDMTAKIRSDKAVAHIPLVLVTSLSKREDRERGMEVGANAYIVKSSFDQSNLLEVVERLLE
ncbi:MAG: hybrid sensor histidine kinase/response regulator [Bacteroidales bacterium]|nr:hybrid sensor histidine kinase/response regulator [Bacteroidales bacterium]